MKLKVFEVSSLEAYSAPAEYIVDLMKTNFVFVLKGNLGAGKTTLVQEVCKLLKTKDVVTSPTFALINPYLTSIGTVYHMDMYRINHVDEAIDFGIEEYIWDDQFCFIEWPEKIELLLPESYIEINIQLQEDQSREVKIENIQQAN
jgi:tRNA threonylcarbamoyladenosine biosynthesis protein TsaE